MTAPTPSDTPRTDAAVFAINAEGIPAKEIFKLVRVAQQLERELIEQQQQIAGTRSEEITSLERDLATATAQLQAAQGMLAEERETVRAHGEEIFRLQAAQGDAERNAKAVEGLRARIDMMVRTHADDWRWYENAAKQALRWLDEHEKRAAIDEAKEPKT